MARSSKLDSLLARMPDGLYNRMDARLPKETAGRLRFGRSRAAFNHYMREKLGGFMVDVDLGPKGSDDIIMKTAVLVKEEAAWSLDANNYFEHGFHQLLTWFKMLEPFGFNLRTVGAVFELGCGSARLIRHLRCMRGVRLVGSDLVPEQVEWCKTNVPGVEFYVNQLDPPLSFAQDNTFDLAFAASVFTHIPLETQQQWIHEMYRILKPGGFLVCDVLGHYHQGRMLDAADMKKFEEQGNFTLTAKDEKASLSTQLIGSWDVFMKRGEFLRVFGKEFEVLDFLPTLLNLFILRKPLSAK